MTDLLTSAQMCAIEHAAIASGAVTAATLMERAGQGVVAAVRAHWPGLVAGPAVVLCGPGNNGGDGHVIARLLRAQGWAVQVFALHPGGGVPALAALEWSDLATRPLVVDALFGTGLTRPIACGVWGALAMAQDSGCALVAVDILSGICADSGRIRAEGGYLDRPADLTVAFHAAKAGHVLDTGGQLTGALAVADIGLAAWHDAYIRDHDAEVAGLAQPSGLLIKDGGHKYTHGHALVLAGGVGRGGAARLAARAALRVGAGLVTVAPPPAALQENACRLDAVMLRAVKGPEALAALLDDPRINTLCLGPGLGVDRAAELLPVALRGPAVVLDADALTALARDAGLMALLHDRCILTPHDGEFARLFPDLAARLTTEAAGPAFGRIDAARAAAARVGCAVLLKGPDTVIAAADGRVCVNAALRESAAPWLATAGAGDVLAGLITGLLARRFPPFMAAETAAWLHVECARGFGPGLIAEDLPEALPRVLRGLAGQA